MKIFLIKTFLFLKASCLLIRPSVLAQSCYHPILPSLKFKYSSWPRTGLTSKHLGRLCSRNINELLSSLVKEQEQLQQPFIFANAFPTTLILHIILHLGITHSVVQSTVYFSVCLWPRVKTIGGPDDIWLLRSNRILAAVFISALFIKLMMQSITCCL